MPERIQKILSAYGVSSRRAAERMILSGRVSVNGVPAVIGQSAEPQLDEITVDGVPLSPMGGHVYIMLNKPRGYITTVADERGRTTVMKLVEDVGTRVYPIGRLDMDSEGLLLMTNDGLFANTVAHPSFSKSKSYEVRVRGDVERAITPLSRPVTIDTHEVCAKSVKLIEKTGDGGILSISIDEGRNRQIRKMCIEVGLVVLSLKRVSVGDLRLGGLALGKWRHLTDSERKSLMGVGR